MMDGRVARVGPSRATGQAPTRKAPYLDSDHAP